MNHQEFIKHLSQLDIMDVMDAYIESKTGEHITASDLFPVELANSMEEMKMYIDNYNTREGKQLRFLKDYHSRIVNEAIRNEDKLGYVSLYVDEDFYLIEGSLKFVEGDFAKDEFTPLKSPKVMYPEGIVDAVYIYYTILWSDNHTKWQVRELTLKGVLA